MMATNSRDNGKSWWDEVGHPWSEFRPARPGEFGQYTTPLPWRVSRGIAKGLEFINQIQRPNHLDQVCKDEECQRQDPQEKLTQPKEPSTSELSTQNNRCPQDDETEKQLPEEAE